jgi:hypothetical protein
MLEMMAVVPRAFLVIYRLKFKATRKEITLYKLTS